MSVSIRPWRIEDAPALATIANNRNVQANLRDGFPYPYTVDDALSFLRSMIDADPHSVYAFAILVDGQLAGSIAAYRKENIHSCTAELGYYVGERYWGQGIATKAVHEICQLLFQSTNLLRIFAEPFAYNAASCRVLEKNGFMYEGTLRHNAVKNGAVLDMKMYALTR